MSLYEAKSLDKPIETGSHGEEAFVMAVLG